ncbi:hypothetical protein [Cellulomonas dongxiuzhuiae]|uniref:LPXTG cell wall anchor domain-containing protein n=1 Tax=Cellulomonas dongxiuzhuiae TaxID=2819979 RepID=A0ABX8GH85_9CELL|nr:hypothetical protein [Cellulomonas dongxiuzhuiae]MBO3088175.1 hypothetical protein [Cellulomonas dongxiuzhuiae]QWC15503.1 hypothetical protein KKR89_14560 [Cellulomonas dongxiuzhuiae]
MSARRTTVLTAASGVLAALTLVGAATAASAGSDAPTPYLVTGAGVELPAGASFQVDGHVNVVYTSALGTAARNVHIEGPGTRFGDLVGTSALTWERAGLPPDACVTWVQVGGYDEHFGEGGQAPVCRTDTPAPVAPPAGPTPVDAPPAAPATTPPSAPAAPPAADAQAPVPTPPAAFSTAPAAPAAIPEAAAAPAPAAASTAPERAEVLAAGATTPSPTPTALVATAERSEVLAATGARTGALLGGAALALTLGSTLVVWRRRRATP